MNSSSIYIHFPFCVRKCRYCDFYSITDTSLIDKYIESLCLEIELRKKENGLDSIDISTIYFGGGTPSILPLKKIKIICEKLSHEFNISKNAEWTIECNPGTLNLESLKFYKHLGINRLSIGIQSFVQSELKLLGRIHSAEEAEGTIKLARNAGFDNISLDLMFSLPGQSIHTLKNTLKKALSFNTEHISAYSLTYEKGTAIFKDLKEGKIRNADEEHDALLYETVMETLNNAGYVHYEVSGFAKPGYKCKHNLNYWSGGEYIGFGPAAHGYLNSVRYGNIRSIEDYIKLLSLGSVPTAAVNNISQKAKMEERLFLELRAEGIKYNEFFKDFNINLLKKLEPSLTFWKDTGIIETKDGLIALTDKGYLVCDYISVLILKQISK